MRGTERSLLLPAQGGSGAEIPRREIGEPRGGPLDEIGKSDRVAHEPALDRRPPRLEPLADQPATC